MDYIEFINTSLVQGNNFRKEKNYSNSLLAHGSLARGSPELVTLQTNPYKGAFRDLAAKVSRGAYMLAKRVTLSVKPR